jgi:hypothetical protein
MNWQDAIRQWCALPEGEAVELAEVEAAHVRRPMPKVRPRPTVRVQQSDLQAGACENSQPYPLSHPGRPA